MCFSTWPYSSLTHGSTQRVLLSKCFLMFRAFSSSARAAAYPCTRAIDRCSHQRKLHIRALANQTTAFDLRQSGSLSVPHVKATKDEFCSHSCAMPSRNIDQKAVFFRIKFPVSFIGLRRDRGMTRGCSHSKLIPHKHTIEANVVPILCTKCQLNRPAWSFYFGEKCACYF